MKQVNFTITPGHFEQLNNLLPDTLKTITINEFIMNHYEFPTNEHKLEHYLTTQKDDYNVVYNIRLKSSTIEKVDKIIEKIELIVKRINPKTKVTRSDVLQDVLLQLIEDYQGKPIKKPKKKIKLVEFELDDVIQLNNYIDSKERSKSLCEYLLFDFEPENLSKTSVNQKEAVSLSMDESVLDLINDYAKDYSVKKTDVYRHAMKGLIKQLKEEKKQQVSNKLDSVIKEYQEQYGTGLEEIINKIKKQK